MGWSTKEQPIGPGAAGTWKRGSGAFHCFAPKGLDTPAQGCARSALPWVGATERFSLKGKDKLVWTLLLVFIVPFQGTLAWVANPG